MDISLLKTQIISNPDIAITLVVLLGLTVVSFSRFYSQSNIPLLQHRGFFELTNGKHKKQFLFNARKTVHNWFKDNVDKPVRLISDIGEMIILPTSMANEIRNDDRLSFSRWSYKAFHAHLPGFEGFREGSSDSHLVQDVILQDLTKYLNKVTKPLVDEATTALTELLPGSKWETLHLQGTMREVVARVSSRIFLGEELCRKKDWLRVIQDYTKDGFQAAGELNGWPFFLRFIVHWFLPSCHRARMTVKQTRQVIEPLLQKRRQQRLELQREGKEIPYYDDAIDWFERRSKGAPYDPATAQLILAVASIHTTTDLISQTIVDLAQHSEILVPLREEIRRVLLEHGWTKQALYNMKLLDSVIKETQRLKPISSVSMRRVAMEDIKLSDGTFIPKNATLGVPQHKMWDSELHKNPEQWDGYRWYNMRQKQGNENVAQLVSTSPDHMGFGHGQHACPGRFFAANEVKIILVQLLGQYEWQLPQGVVPKIYEHGFSMGSDPSLKMSFRRRDDEIDWSQLTTST